MRRRLWKVETWPPHLRGVIWIVTQPLHELHVPGIVHETANASSATIPVVAVYVINDSELCIGAPRAPFSVPVSGEITPGDSQAREFPVHVQAQRHIDIRRLLGVKSISLFRVHEQMRV